MIVCSVTMGVGPGECFVEDFIVCVGISLLVVIIERHGNVSSRLWREVADFYLHHNWGLLWLLPTSKSVRIQNIEINIEYCLLLFNLTSADR